jgi:hypothetical protein
MAIGALAQPPKGRIGVLMSMIEDDPEGRLASGHPWRGCRKWAGPRSRYRSMDSSKMQPTAGGVWCAGKRRRNMTIPIKCVLVEWKAMEMGQYGEAYCATFRIGTEPHFDIPIWLPKETQEEDIITKAHVMLHDLASRIADQTAGWKINRQNKK